MQDSGGDDHLSECAAGHSIGRPQRAALSNIRRRLCPTSGRPLVASFEPCDRCRPSDWKVFSQQVAATAISDADLLHAESELGSKRINKTPEEKVPSTSPRGNLLPLQRGDLAASPARSSSSVRQTI